MKYKIEILILSALVFFQLGCATQTKNIAAAMFAGAAVGAVVGHQFDDYGDPQTNNRNTITAAIVTSLVAGGLMEWHYQELEAETERISGRYARLRLCDPDDMRSKVEGEFDNNKIEKSTVYQIGENQLGRLAISLDDNTKWAYPIFRKRYLQPELGETQMTSERYIWEIIKPGSFVTRSQNPYFFLQSEGKK